jgi:hypothetical protein
MQYYMVPNHSLFFPSTVWVESMVLKSKNSETCACMLLHYYAYIVTTCCELIYENVKVILYEVQDSN